LHDLQKLFRLAVEKVPLAKLPGLKKGFRAKNFLCRVFDSLPWLKDY